MRVLLVSDYGTPTGGVEILLGNLRAKLRDRGHDARLFTSSARPAPVASLADYECFGTTSRWRTLLQAANPSAPRRLKRVLEEFRPDVVHVRMFLTQLSPWILPLLRNVPSLLHLETYRTFCPSGTKMLPDGSLCQVQPGAPCYREGCLPLRDWLVLMPQMRLWRRWSSVFDAVVADSEWVARRAREAGLSVTDVVLNAAPIADVGAHERRGAVELDERPTVGFAGRLVPEKGTHVLLEAMQVVVRTIPDARLLLAGDGPERARLASMVRALGLERAVEMLGHLEPAEVERRLRGASVQAVPSLWEEPFGLVAVEAMMRGTAVVASARGGLTEIVVDGETGYLVAPGSSERLAEALAALLGNADLALEMGRNGRRLAVERFEFERLVDDVLRIYERIAAA